MIKNVKKITFHFVFQQRRNFQSKSFYILLNTYIDIEEGILNFKSMILTKLGMITLNLHYCSKFPL